MVYLKVLEEELRCVQKKQFWVADILRFGTRTAHLED